jgi:hypothetical protein
MIKKDALKPQKKIKNGNVICNEEIKKLNLKG